MAQSSPDRDSYEQKIMERFGGERQLELPMQMPVPAQQEAANWDGPIPRVLLFGFCRGTWIAFWSCRPDWASRSRGTRWSGRSGNSGRTRRPSGTLGTCIAFRTGLTGWSGWSFKAASECQAGNECNCCHDAHTNPPPINLPLKVEPICLASQS